MEAFCQYVPQGFSESYFMVDEVSKSKYLRVLQTWHVIFPPKVISLIEGQIFRPAPIHGHSGISNDSIGYSNNRPPTSQRTEGFQLEGNEYFNPQFLETNLFPLLPPPHMFQGRSNDYPTKRPRIENSEATYQSNPIQILSQIQNFLQDNAGEEKSPSTVNNLEQLNKANSANRQIRPVPTIELNYQALLQQMPDDFYYIYDFYPLQCNNCGLRYEDSLAGRSQLDFHLDCHFKQARRLKDRMKKTLSRDWFLPEKEWILNFTDSNDVLAERETIDAFLDTTANKKEQPNTNKSLVVVSEAHSGSCALCGEVFEKIWAPEMDDFVWKDVTLDRNNNPVHIACND